MIRRPPRSTHCISSAASDVYKRQVEECAELVKKRGHLHFAFLRNAVCLEQPKPWSKCRRIRKGRFDLYKIKAEPAPPAPPPAPPAPPTPSTWSSTWSSTPSTYSYSAATCKRDRGKFVDGKCWHMATTDTSCEETCADKNLQYDEGTHLGSPKNPETWDKCVAVAQMFKKQARTCLLYTSPSPRDVEESRMPSSA